jgi:hypothetical protein
MELEAIGEQTRDALSHKRRNGERVGNIAYGFCLASDGAHVEPDSREQAILARIHELPPTYSLRRIATLLNQDGNRTRSGTPWRIESAAGVINGVKDGVT